MEELDAARPDFELPQEIFKKSTDFLEMNYQYGIKHIVNMENFYELMKPQQRRNLIFNVLKAYYLKFQHFFYDEQIGFQASDRFIMKVLSNLECKVF